MKNPYLKFYTSDFLIGTMTWQNEHVGMYIRMLCFEHDRGKIHVDELPAIIQCRWDDLPPVLKSKFKLSRHGYLTNERLQKEMAKMKKYVESQRANALKRRKKPDGDKQPVAVAVATPARSDNDNNIFISDRGRVNVDDEISEMMEKFRLELKNGERPTTVEMIQKITGSKFAIKKYLTNFEIHIKHERKLHKTVHELAKHFVNWSRRYAQENETPR